MQVSLRWLIVGAATTASLGCGFTPFTDIVSTNTEQVGDYRVIGRATADAFSATVCAAEPQHARSIAQRIIFQLHSHAYRSIDLDVVGSGAGAGSAATRVTWTPHGGARVTSGNAAGPTPCNRQRTRRDYAPVRTGERR